MLSDAAISLTMLRGTKLTVSMPALKVALATLGRHWPCSVSFDALVSETSAQLPESKPTEIASIVESALWDIYCVGGLDLRLASPRCAAAPTERPLTSKLARAQLAHGDMVTNQHHDFTRLGDPLSRELFLLLDGSRDRAQLVDALLPRAKQGALSPLPSDMSASSIAEEIQRRLDAWAKHALLVPA
jgi:hypothetical protein